MLNNYYGDINTNININEPKLLARPEILKISDNSYVSIALYKADLSGSFLLLNIYSTGSLNCG